MRTLAALLLLSLPLTAGSPLRSAGQRLFVKDGKLTLRLSRSVHFGDGSTGVDRRESAASVHAAVFHAARAWSTTGKAAVTVAVEFTDNNLAGLGGENVVTFNDPAPYDSGVCDKATYVACTLISYVAGTGEVQAVTVAFNPYLRHSSIGLGLSHDIGAVMLHEIGHTIGLDHSPVMDSVMALFLEVVGGAPDGRFVPQRLASDDVFTLAETYPNPELAGTLARLEGRLTVDNAPAAGAHVLAISAGGRAIHGAMTNAAGLWQMVLDPGEYRLVAEPLDGPMYGVSFTQAQPVSPKFATAFWSLDPAQSAGGETLSLAPGELRGDLAMNLAAAVPSNLESIGLVEGGQYLGHGRVVVARGDEYMFGWTRSPNGNGPTIQFTLPNVLLDGEPRVSAASPQLVRQKITVPAGATPGAFTVMYHDEAGNSLLAGSFVVVLKPVMGGVLDATMLTPPGAAYPGQLLLIYGREFALEETVVDQIRGDLAWPTQVAGVSVRIGDRYAPVRYVSRTQIIVEVPEGIAGAAAALSVVTGPVTQSAPVSLRLAVQ